MEDSLIISDIRSGCHDMWNAFMVKNADFTYGSDIPMCPSSNSVPTNLISYDDAKHIHKSNIKNNADYHINAFVHFYIDDQKFDGKRNSIWNNPYDALEIIRHFEGAISPDFSTNADFPHPIKCYNTYRMRAFGLFLHNNNIPVINNVRWGTEETWSYCFDGIPHNSIVAIGTVASGLTKTINRPIFATGLFEMVNILHPHTIIVYGSSNYSFFDKLRESGINIVSFQSKTCLAFSAKRGGELHV